MTELNEPLLGDNPSHDPAHNSTHATFIAAFVMLTLILAAININGILHKRNFHYLGESAVTIILGLVVATAWTTLSSSTSNYSAIQLSSQFFSLVLLPPIIFEGGFTLQRVAFFQNVLTITALAFIGALYSTFVTSVLMYFFSKLAFPLSFVESLVFGSLISSTDPVTVLSLLPSNVDRRLYMIIFGESALNDAVAIILYRFFTGLADPKMRLGAGPFFLSVVAAAGVFLGSFLVGVVAALVYAWITKNYKFHDAPIYETTMLFIFAYASYLLADILNLTGIISIFFCGITMSQYAYDNLEKETVTALKISLRFLSSICENFIFLYLGLGLRSFKHQTDYNFLMILFACISILISRTHVFVILGLRNVTQKDANLKIPWNHQVLIWFSGLRGAVAFALGVTFLEHPVFATDVKGVIFGTTEMVVVITVLVLGGLTPYMLKWLKIVAPNEGQDLEHQPVTQEYQSLGDDDDQHEQKADSKVLFSWLKQFDAKYIRPHFTIEKKKPDNVEWMRNRSGISVTQPEPPKLEPEEKAGSSSADDRFLKTAQADEIELKPIELETVDLSDTKKPPV